MGDCLNRFIDRISAPLLALLFAVAAFALYGVALRAPFLFDDYTSIVANTRLVRLWNYIPPAGPRGVGYLSFALNYAASGLEPAPYRAVNIAIHALNGLLVFYLLGRVADHLAPERKGGRNRALAAAAALLFLVHPVQTGAVTYVVQRFTSLSTLFYLLSFTCYLSAAERYRREGRFLDRGHLAPYVASVVSVLLAMKTKEIAFTLPLAILAWEFLFRRKGGGGGDWPVPLAYYLPLALSILVVPAQFLGSTSSIGELLGEVERRSRETTEIGRWEYFLTEARVLVIYVRLLFVPVGQNLDYDFVVSRSLLEPAVLLSFSFHALLVAAAVRIYRRAASGIILLIPFGVFWFYLTLSVESFIMPIHDVIFEHRMYLPSPGMIAAAAALLATAAERLPGERGRKALPCLLAASLLVLSALTVSRNLLWSDGIGVWRDAIAKSPGKARPRANLAELYLKLGRTAEAERELVEALRIDPSIPLLHNTLGNVYKLQGRFPEATAEYERALLLDPRLAEAFYGVGTILAEKGDRQGALQYLRKAVELSPGMYEAYVVIANVYDVMGRKEEALRLYAYAIAIRPDYDLAWFNQGILREGTGDREGARGDYRKALSLNPSLESARKRLETLGR